MKFQSYLNEEKDSLDKIFIRIGPGSGQKQTHKTHKMAPEKKGIWLLPIQGARDLTFLGSGVDDRLKVLKKDKEKYNELEKQFELEKDFDKKIALAHKLENNKSSFKLNYKKFDLKSNITVWCHIGTGIPDLNIEGWNWYKVSVSEYWSLFKRAYAKTIGGMKRSGSNILTDWEFFEIFYPTT